jgi:hypothetical protein
MGEMKVEHVLLFLVGAFLVYHMMGKCGRVEGMSQCSNCTNPFTRCLVDGVCTGAVTAGICNNKGGTWCPDHVDTIPGQTGPDTSGGHMTECDPQWSREQCLGPKDPHFRGNCFWNTQSWPYTGWCDTDRGR